MKDLYNEITAYFKEKPEVLFGFSNIDFSEYKSSYKCALAFAVPHSEILRKDNYDEKRFVNLINEARDKIAAISQDITAKLSESGIPFLIPSAQTSKETLMSSFSLKFACVNAGLGWIGKNDVLITEKYGPRVRPSAILIDYEFPTANPVIESKCPDDCRICVETCPNEVLKGVKWDIEKKREEIIDYQTCDKNRNLNNGARFSCGLCMVSCPYGIKK